MFIREELHMIERGRTGGQEYLPEWIRSEHLERFVPLRELWKYARSAGAVKRAKR